jgi:bacterioferritin-associated ferredoxin
VQELRTKLGELRSYDQAFGQQPPPTTAAPTADADDDAADGAGAIPEGVPPSAPEPEMPQIGHRERFRQCVSGARAGLGGGLSSICAELAAPAAELLAAGTAEAARGLERLQQSLGVWRAVDEHCGGCFQRAEEALIAQVEAKIEGAVGAFDPDATDPDAAMAVIQTLEHLKQITAVEEVAASHVRTMRDRIEQAGSYERKVGTSPAALSPSLVCRHTNAPRPPGRRLAGVPESERGWRVLGLAIAPVSR